MLDSDDDDDDFSPVKHPVAPPPLDGQDGNHNGNTSLETPRNRRAESTDPSFFRNVYEDQRVAADAQQSTSSVAALSSELVSTTWPNPPHDLSHVNVQNDLSHLSSISDPVSASRRRQGRSDMKEVADLTQVTTPGRPTPKVPADIWDFPASPEPETAGAGSNVTQTGTTKKPITIKLKKTDTKRENALNSSIRSPETHRSSDLQPVLSVTQAEGSSDANLVEPPQKRRRISSSRQHAPNSQEVDLLTIPRSEDKPARDDNHVTPTGNSSSVVEDSLKGRKKSLLVVPSTTMTASQKDEYRFISLSSEADRSHDLPNVFEQTDDLQKSSGSATIKYPTPIEYASSGRRGPSPGDYGTASSSRPKRRRQNVVESDPVCNASSYKRTPSLTSSQHSSPDIISRHVAGPSSTSKGAAENAPTGYSPNSRPARSSRRRAKSKAFPDDLSPSSPVSENERPRSNGRNRSPSRRGQERDREARSSSPAQVHTGAGGQYADDSAELTHLAIEEQLAAIPEEPPQKKTRGRKRKEASGDAVVEERLPDTAAPHTDENARAGDGVTESPAEPAPKKRRGRPRKEPQSHAIAIDHDKEIFQPDPEVAAPLEADEMPKPKKRRGRPRKVEVAKPAEEDDTSDLKADMAQQAEGTEKGKQSTNRTPSKKAINETSSKDEKTQALLERDSNSNLGASPAKPTPPARDGVDDTAKENQAAETKAKDEVKKETKGSTPSSQLAKVQYRVGLSKKSRIAPLLKSFRK